MKSLRVGVIGCGLIGSRRAKEAGRHPQTCLEMVADVNAERCARLAADCGCRSTEQWGQVVDDELVDVVVVSTPNAYIAEIAVAALAAGKDVLVEKPPGRSLSEAKKMADAARRARRVLKIGFNHRYHPAISRAHRLVSEGVIGNVINMRACYGHGGRPGYEKEWRCDPALSGGGELMDQGVHLADLFHWFAGFPSEAFAVLQTAVWPIHPLEDNAFGLFRYENGIIASLHTSWTQWKNLFAFEIFGSLGSLGITGLGGSYGTEQLITVVRNQAGGAPAVTEELFNEPDRSWRAEWEDFVEAVAEGKPYGGTPDDGVAAMAMIEGLYRSANSRAIASLARAEL